MSTITLQSAPTSCQKIFNYFKILIENEIFSKPFSNDFKSFENSVFNIILFIKSYGLENFPELTGMFENFHRNLTIFSYVLTYCGRALEL